MRPALTPRNLAACAEDVLDFWFNLSTPQQWFVRDHVFDQQIRDRFSALHADAVAGRLDALCAHPKLSLALIIILDQFSRNLIRDDAGAFAYDGQALMIAQNCLARRFDMICDEQRRAFMYMPFMHSERLGMQKKSVELFKARMPASDNLSHAIEHHDIIARFGRFPHRNRVLDRQSTPDELRFLKQGGFNP